MKKLYNLIFVITLLLITGLITNVDAVSLSNQDGRITVTREVTDVHNPVTNTFTYELTADNNNPVAVTGMPISFNIVFNRTVPVIPSGEWDGTATQTGTLDLTGINFTKVGDYKFKLNEQYSTNPSNYPTEFGTYEIVVSVRNQVDSNNHPTGILTASLAYIRYYRYSTTTLQKVSDVVFSCGFNPVEDPISITKEVQGNMANADEYFKVLVDIDCPTGDTYPIEYFDILNDTYDVDRTISYNGSNVNRLPNSQIWREGTEYEYTSYYAPYTCGQNNYVYLKHGERAEIYYLLNGTEYSFTEQGATNYETYINGSSNNSKESGTLSTPEIETSGGSDGRANILGKKFITKNMANESCTADYCPTIDYGEDHGGNIILNVETSEVPTGVILKYLPYAILVLVTIGGLTFFVIAKRKTKEEN